MQDNSVFYKCHHCKSQGYHGFEPGISAEQLFRDLAEHTYGPDDNDCPAGNTMMIIDLGRHFVRCTEEGVEEERRARQ